MVKIVIADTLHEVAGKILNRDEFEVVDVSTDKDTLINELSNAEALIVRSATKVTLDILDKSPLLKIIGRAGVGLDNIDLVECKKRGIKVVNSPEGPTRTVAELTLGLMIAASRQLNLVNSGTKKGTWPKKTKGMELFGKKLGIIGSGAIGGTLAKYCIALGMSVIAYDIVHLDELEQLDNFDYVALDHLLENSDYISLHVPLVSATKHMINSTTLDKMKDGVVIVNCARGGVIDEDALLAAVVSGKVFGVALDVYENEPVDINHALIQHERVLTTAHIGAQTYKAAMNNSTIVCEKIIKFFA